MITKNTIEKVLLSADFGGFTQFIKGAEKRYIVAFTHFEFEEGEKIESISEKLATFSNGLSPNMQSITIGGWRNPQNEKLYIDFGIATNEREFALRMGETFSQITIWDNEIFDTIIVGSDALEAGCN